MKLELNENQVLLVLVACQYEFNHIDEVVRNYLSQDIAGDRVEGLINDLGNLSEVISLLKGNK